MTDTMRALLMDQLTEVWHESLDDRLLLAPRSPAPILDRLLQQRAAERWHPVSRSHPGRTQVTPTYNAVRAGPLRGNRP
ncbi:hypothetical protein [Streptomyces kanasensis]|uniref:hypothetical protein n=1 Tax=Streptomyces kanasensis TaxID=936756 RepID=UPI0037FBD118